MRKRVLPARWLVAVVCLGFTGPAVAWAEGPHSADYVEDPYAPHHTWGQTARLGTSVGFIYGERLDVLALGLTAAYGERFGRLTLEAEYTYLGFQVKGPSDLALGNGQRLGAVARFDVIRLGPRVVGENSLVAIYVEGGAAVAWNHWYAPGNDEPMRVVPEDSKRVEGQAGFGFMLDHRLQEPIGFPHRIGWFLGWRLAMAPHATESAAICRGVSCAPAPPMPHDRFTDRSMLFQSSLSFTW